MRFSPRAAVFLQLLPFIRQKLPFFAVANDPARLYAIGEVQANASATQERTRRDTTLNQHYRPDPILFIRIQLENAWDAGDLEGALRMSHLMDEAMLGETSQDQALQSQAI